MAAFVSWVLIILFAVVLSAIMLNWTRSYVTKQGEDLTSRSDTLLCGDTSINIDGMCQNTQTLNMNVTNNNNLEIDKLRIRFIDLYDASEVKKIDLKLAAGDSEKYTVLKQGTTKQVKVTPIVLKKDKEIVCEDKSFTFEEIKQC